MLFIVPPSIAARAASGAADGEPLSFEGSGVVHPRTTKRNAVAARAARRMGPTLAPEAPGAEPENEDDTGFGGRLRAAPHASEESR